MKKLINDLVARHNFARVIKESTDEIIIQCSYERTALRITHLLTEAGYITVMADGKHSDNKYIKVYLLDHSLHALEQRWSDPTYGIIWH